LVVDKSCIAQALEDQGAFADATATVEDDQGWVWSGVLAFEDFEFVGSADEGHSLG
jgi:hypothetical protein